MKRSVAACVALTTITLVLPPRTRAQSAAPEGWRAEPFKLTSPGGDFEIALAGYAQEDFRSYRDWTLLEAQTSELRRLRIGTEGKWKRLSFEVDVDPRKERPEDTTEGAHHLKNAYLEFRFAKAFRIRAGHFKIPFSGEFLTSASKTDFVERAMIVDAIGVDRDWGGVALGEIGPLSYEAGVFQGDGWRSHPRAETTGAARLMVRALTGLDLAVSYTEGRVEADDESLLAPEPKGFNVKGPAGFTFSSRHFVNGRRRRLGGDAELQRGPVGLRAEIARGWEERNGQGSTFDDLPQAVLTGWTVSGTWLITGDKKRNTIRPRSPMFHGPGAVEIGVRYEEVRMDDDGPDTGFAGSGNRARNIRPAADRALTGGISWWPRRWMRFMGNVVLERFEDELLAPEPDRGGNYTTLLGRLQLSLP
jgi:phosphate-selective porin OprO and OprP